MSEPRQNQKPSLEDLLRLKRAERPTPEFWANFETELRQKQLTALVEKRRWWHDLPVRLSRRVYVPAGAAAVAAFTLVAVRYNAPLPVAQLEHTAPRIEASDPAVAPLPAASVAANPGRYEEPVAVAQPVPQPVVDGSDTADYTAAIVPVVARAEVPPSARSIAATLAGLEQAEPELVNAAMGHRLSAAARVEPALAQPTPESTGAAEALPKYRLIARYAERALSPEPSAPALVRERLARRLGDDLSDNISRIGLVGDRVSLKF